MNKQEENTSSGSYKAYLKNSFLDLFMCVSVLLTCKSVHHVCTWCPGRSEKGAGPLKLQLWTAVRHNVAAENWIQQE